MALTLGNAPLARPPGGTFNFDYLGASPGHTLYLEPSPKRVRGVLGGETVVDSRRVHLLHESNLMVRWYFPLEDVRADLLRRSETTTHCPFKGDASYWSLVVGDRVVEDAVWSYEQPLPQAPPLAGLCSIYFERLDAWYEEEDEVRGHPRDPYHRFDCRRTAEQVEVLVGGEPVARTHEAVKLFETGLPPRYYVPRQHVREDALTPSETQTYCPYKGAAAYWTVAAGGVTVEDGAWGLPEPLGEAEIVRDHLSFLGEGVEVRADGRPVAL